MTAPVAPMEARIVRPWEMRLAEAMQEVQRDPSKRTLLEIGGLKAKALAAEIADWRALAATPVAPTQEIHCQEFHELAMDYRAAPAFTGAPAAYKALCDYVNARLAPVAQPAQQVEAAGQVPPGWKLVPEEPTAEMYRAAAKIDNEMFAGGSSHGAEDGQVWAAMYDAAPNSTQLEAQQAGDVALLPQCQCFTEQQEQYCILQRKCQGKAIAQGGKA